MYTRLTGRGCHDDASRCTCTASSILAGEVNATSPSIPAVLRPALRWVACRTLISVLLQLRSINLCRFLTVARSPSCAAVKIRCRSRRTLSLWCRQSTASHERATSSGPFTIGCLTCPSVPATWGPHHFTGSPVHVSTPFEAGHRARYPASYPATTAWRSHSRLCWFPVGFRPPAFASWTSCSRQRIPLSSRSAYRPATRTARTLSGFPCSARMSCDRVGCLLYPGAAVSSRPAQPLRSAPAASQRPALYSAETSHRRSC